MESSFAAFADTVKEIFGGFSGAQMIAIGIVLLIVLVLGFMIGALSLYAAGVKKGRGQKKLSARTLKELRKENEMALAEADKKTQALLAEREADAAALKETKERLEQVEASKLEAEEQMRQMMEKGEGSSFPRKTSINALTKGEVLAFANGLEEYIPANVYERGGDNLPDSCRVGICTFMLVYERKDMVKIVLRLHKKTAADLKKKFKLFTKAVYPKGGDWYKWILSSEVTSTAVVEAAIRMAYKYTYLTNYGEGSGELDVDYVNMEEAKINEDILRYKDLPDRDFVVASDATSTGAAYSLYGKKEMVAYALSLANEYPVTAAETESETTPSTCKVVDKSFLLAYEKDGVAKIIFRVSEEEFEEIRKKHPKAEISTFPNTTLYHWYVTLIDESFRSNADIEEIIKSACAHVYSLYK